MTLTCIIHLLYLGTMDHQEQKITLSDPRKVATGYCDWTLINVQMSGLRPNKACFCVFFQGLIGGSFYGKCFCVCCLSQFVLLRLIEAFNLKETINSGLSMISHIA